MVAVASFITYRYRQEVGRRKLAIDMYCALPTSNRLESTVVDAFFLRLVVVSVAMLAMTWL